VTALRVAGLVIGGLIGFNVGFVTTIVLARRHAKRVCHFCLLHQARPGDLFCSSICADLEFGMLREVDQ
jgi:hypothetical protein